MRRFPLGKRPRSALSQQGLSGTVNRTTAAAPSRLLIGWRSEPILKHSGWMLHPTGMAVGWSSVSNANHITFLYGMTCQTLNKILFRSKNGFFWRHKHAELMDDCGVNCALSIFMDGSSATNEKPPRRTRMYQWA